MGNMGACMSAKASTKLSIDINITSWTKMHNLYDHIGSDLKNYSSFSTSENIIAIKYQDQWKQISSLEEIRKIDKNHIQSYFDVSKEHRTYSIFNNIFNNEGLGDGSSVWKVIEDKEDLKVNDVVKLGRFRFKLIDMITTEAVKEEADEVESIYTCKICYSNEQSINNPLLTPCLCSGTMKHIHLDCLRHWIAKTCKIVSTQNIAEIPSKQACCQLCGKEYEPIITHQGRMFCVLYDNYTIKPPYIQLNLLEKDTNNSKISYIVSFSNLSTIKIGRANECQIQPKQDISISRIHAELTLRNGVLSIRNMNSKFGTLKLVKEPQVIFNVSLVRRYQIANSLIEVQTRSISNRDKNEQDLSSSIDHRCIRQSLVGVQPRIHNAGNYKTIEQFRSEIALYF